MSRTDRLGFVVAAAALVAASALADEPYSALRGETPLVEEGPAPRMMPEQNTDLREVRNYPEQPPVIPHETDGYIIDARSNKCLSCHARARTGESQAPMVSITHFMDRDGQFLAAISPRRYFCTQCHVSQLDVTPPVENDFVDIDSLLRASQGGQ
jgi:cytochrome c-type protein NapB